jgi:hypothetical protein
MEDEAQPAVVEQLPSQPIPAKTVKALGESDALTGTRPIESRFNDVITEFLVYKDESIHALAFDPKQMQWQLLESRSYTAKTRTEVEKALMDQLHEWREEHVLSFLVEQDLIPNFVL